MARSCNSQHGMSGLRPIAGICIARNGTAYSDRLRRPEQRWQKRPECYERVVGNPLIDEYRVIRRDNSTSLGFHPKGKKRSSTDGLTAALEEMRRSGRSTPARRIAGCWASIASPGTFRGRMAKTRVWAGWQTGIGSPKAKVASAVSKK